MSTPTVAESSDSIWTNHGSGWERNRFVNAEHSLHPPIETPPKQQYARYDLRAIKVPAAEKR
jgi:hypothetical protein